MSTTSDAASRGLVERELATEQAWQRTCHLLDQHGWQAHLSAVRPELDWGPWQAHLSTEQGQPLPEGAGAGKGQRESARLGAVCEALEHHLTQDLSSYQPELHQAGPLSAAYADDVLGPLLAEQPAATLACLPYRALAGPGELLVPLGLIAPAYLEDDTVSTEFGDDFDYRPMAPYASSNGSALGSSYAEAALHALNELIERDALSLLLCQAFLGGDYQPRVIDPASLPQDLAELHRRAQDVAGPVWLLEITTDLGVPSMLAYSPPGPRRDRHARGLGTSLDAQYATYRALSELIQIELLGDTTPPEQLQHLDALDPLLTRAGEFDLTDHLREATWHRLAPRSEPTPVGSQLTQVLAMLDRHGLSPYCHTVLHDVLTVVHVVVPGLERIMTLLQGHPALPGPRGLAALQARPALPMPRTP